MDFKEASGRLTNRPTQDDIAQAIGVSRNSIGRARLDPESGNYRKPPRGWKSGVAQVARQRAQELLELAEELADDC